MARNIPNKAANFRLMGETILKGERPANMTDFLKGTNHNRSSELHKPTDTQLHKPTFPEFGRLHLQIRQDLIDRLLDEVFRRKKDSSIGNRRATQRAVIEDALEKFFSGKYENNGDDRCIEPID